MESEVWMSGGPHRRALASYHGESSRPKAGMTGRSRSRAFPLIGESTPERERARWLAPSWMLGAGGPSPPGSLCCRLADGDNVAFIATRVDVAGGDRPT